MASGPNQTGYPVFNAAKLMKILDMVFTPEFRLELYFSFETMGRKIVLPLQRFERGGGKSQEYIVIRKKFVLHSILITTLFSGGFYYGYLRHHEGSPRAPADGKKRMTRGEKMIIGLTGCSHALTHGYLLIFPAVLLLLKKDFDLGYLGLGVVSNIMSFSYGLGALPGGMIFNRFGPKKLYLFCFLGSTLTCLLIAVSPNLLVFTIGLAILGALGSVYHPLANALISAKVKEFGRGLGIHGATGNIGLATAPFLAGLIGSQWGWRFAYLAFMLPGVVLSIWALFVDMTIEKLQKPNQPAAPADSRSVRETRGFWIYFSLPLILLYSVNMLQSFGFHGVVTFLPTYMSQYTSFQILHWDSVAIGGMLSGIALFMGVFGQYTGGLLAEKKNLKRNIAVMGGVSLPFILAMAFATDVLLLIMSLSFFFFTFALQPMLNTVTAHYTTLEMRGTAFGIYFFAAFGLGSMAASFAGFIAQNFGLPWV
ncbi:MAG: major facilitator superfamily 1, partial [Deltaproteobacteria bacterium]|nr:major facilitator superfamily 1 [Deltaproteobacteria bacterium]